MRVGHRSLTFISVVVLLPVLIHASVPTWESFLLHGNRSSIRGRSRTLYICPVSGLAGRLRTIASAANFAWRHKAKLVMVWGPGGEFDNEVGAAFSDMFSSPVIDTVDTFPPGCDITHRYEAPVDESTLLFQRQGDREALCVVSGHWMGEGWPQSVYWFYKRALQPSAEVLRKINNFKASAEWQSHGWFGVQIRHGDSDFGSRSIDSYVNVTHSLLQYRSSPTASWVLHPARVLVATDSADALKDFETHFAEKLGKPGLVWSVPTFRPSIEAYRRETMRSTVGGMQDAVVDLFLLSECQVLIAGTHTSFAATAALMGNPMYVALQKDGTLQNYGY